ncbi:MAG: hypothetical protein ACYTFI_28120 [Planctomycetota bacterium]
MAKRVSVVFGARPEAIKLAPGIPVGEASATSRPRRSRSSGTKS